VSDDVGKSSRRYTDPAPESGLRELRARVPGHVLVAQPIADGKWAVYVSASEMVANDATVLASYSDVANDEDG
jgi:hypothetical protein